jgi:acetyl esterase
VKLPEPIETAAARLLGGLPAALVRTLAGRPVIVDGQRLDPEAQFAQRLLDLDPPPPIESLPIVLARARLEHDARVFSGPRVEVAEVRDLEVGGAGGRLPARLYVGATTARPSALLVFFHGGGWTVGSIDSHDNLCRFLARRASIRVLSVGYRLAPESRFPAAAEDALASFHDSLARADELGADPARVAVGGDSAGGNLAAVACLLAREGGGPTPALQLLIYPVAQLGDRDRPSYGLFGEGFYLTTAEMDWYDANYLVDPEQARDWRASPLLADDLGGLPPALVVIAGFDPLRDECEEYARRLADAGVEVEVKRAPGLPHGFANAASAGRAAPAAMRSVARALGDALGSLSPSP